jgi:glyoxylase-like metal-dependent hydrolase (beta-lactamase superfamily II)
VARVPVSAQADGRLRPRPAAPSRDAPLYTMKVQGSVHVIVGAGANVAVQVGDLGPIVVDTGTAAARRCPARVDQDADRAAGALHHQHPLARGPRGGQREDRGRRGCRRRDAASAQVGAGLGARAEIIAHEQTLNRLSAPAGAQAPTPVAPGRRKPSRARKDFFYNGEAVQVIHLAAAHTDGDSVVFFRRSDVIAAGDVYSTVSYPMIDLQRGGSIKGVLDGLNQLLDLVVSGEKTEGGTMIVPGHGRISDEADLVEYRDMTYDHPRPRAGHGEPRADAGAGAGRHGRRWSSTASTATRPAGRPPSSSRRSIAASNPPPRRVRRGVDTVGGAEAPLYETCVSALRDFRPYKETRHDTTTAVDGRRARADGSLLRRRRARPAAGRARRAAALHGGQPARHADRPGAGRGVQPDVVQRQGLRRDLLGRELLLRPGRGVIVVPNRGVAQNVQTNNGWISFINHDGSVHTARWVGIQNPGEQRSNMTTPLVLNEPLGSDIANGVLYLADRDGGTNPNDPVVSVVRKFNMQTGMPAGEVRVEKSNGFNDLEVANDGTIYATQTGTDRRQMPRWQVWKITPAGARRSSCRARRCGSRTASPSTAGQHRRHQHRQRRGADVLADGKLLKTENAVQAGNDGLVIMKDGTKYVSSVSTAACRASVRTAGRAHRPEHPEPGVDVLRRGRQPAGDPDERQQRAGVHQAEIVDPPDVWCHGVKGRQVGLREPLLDGAEDRLRVQECRWPRESRRSRVAHTPLVPTAFSRSCVKSIGAARTRSRRTHVPPFGFAVANELTAHRLDLWAARGSVGPTITAGAPAQMKTTRRGLPRRPRARSFSPACDRRPRQNLWLPRVGTHGPAEADPWRGPPEGGPYFFPMSVNPAAGPNSVPIGPNDILWPPGIVTVRPATTPSAAPKATSLR